MEPLHWKAWAGKWFAALVGAYLMTLGALGLGFKFVFTHPFRLRFYVEDTEAVHHSLGYLVVGGFLLWFAHRMDEAD